MPGKEPTANLILVVHLQGNEPQVSGSGSKLCWSPTLTRSASEASLTRSFPLVEGFRAQCKAPKVRHSIAQGKRSAALGHRTPRHPAPQRGAIPPRAVAAAMVGVAPRWGAGCCIICLPRAALRLPWAIEYDPFGVESRGENDVKKAGRSR